jgi:hypothetical protein
MRAEVKKVGEKEFEVVLGNHVIGTAKSDCDARFHMHAINKAIDSAEQGEHWKGQADGYHGGSESERSQNELEPLP